MIKDGRYQIGRFYFQLLGKHNDEFRQGQMVHPKKDDLYYNSRLFTVYHELIHYLQDLSLGICMQSDYMMDESMGILFNHLRGNRTQINFLNHTQCNELDAFRMAKESYLNSQQIVEKRESIKFNFSQHSDTDFELSSLNLIETSACIRTLFSICSALNDPNDHSTNSYLNDFVKELKLAPELMSDEYASAYEIFIKTIVEQVYKKQPEERIFPFDYLNSKEYRKFIDINFLILSQIALDIPPYGCCHILDENSTYPDECYSPNLRFKRIIELIVKKGRFPDFDQVRYNNFYEQLFDYIADELNWPNYKITNIEWKLFLLFLRDETGIHSAGYRYRSRYEKLSSPYNFIIYDNPYNILGKTMAPLFYLSDSGFTIQRFIGEGPGSFYFPFTFDEMPLTTFLSPPFKKWKSVNGPANIEEEFDKHIIFGQEMLFRILEREFQYSVFEGKKLLCPLSRGACKNAEGNCKNITSFREKNINNCYFKSIFNNTLQIPMDNLFWEDMDEQST